MFYSTIPPSWAYSLTALTRLTVGLNPALCGPIPAPWTPGQVVFAGSLVNQDCPSPPPLPPFPPSPPFPVRWHRNSCICTLVQSGAFGERQHGHELCMLITPLLTTDLACPLPRSPSHHLPHHLPSRPAHHPRPMATWLCWASGTLSSPPGQHPWPAGSLALTLATRCGPVWRALAPALWSCHLATWTCRAPCLISGPTWSTCAA